MTINTSASTETATTAYMYNIRIGGIRLEIDDFLFDGNGNVCSNFHHLTDIFAKKYIKCQKFDFEMNIKTKE